MDMFQGYYPIPLILAFLSEEVCLCLWRQVFPDPVLKKLLIGGP